MFNYTLHDPTQVEFIDIAPPDQLASGERLFVEVEGRSIVLLNLAGKYFAIGDICTHDNLWGTARWRKMRSSARGMVHVSTWPRGKPPPCRLWWTSLPTR